MDPHIRVMDARRDKLAPGDVSVIVAGIVPAGLAGSVMQGDLQPLWLTMGWRNGREEPVRFDVRDLTPEEVIMVVNRALEDQRVQFGFRVNAARLPTLFPGKS